MPSAPWSTSETRSCSWPGSGCDPIRITSSAGSSYRFAGCSTAVRPEGVFRADIASARLTESLIGLIVGVLVSTPALGKEDMIASITGLFLDGARARGPRPAMNEDQPTSGAHHRPSPERSRRMDEE